MTREEAIITLKNTAALLRDGTQYIKPEHEKQFREAYEMAIKALEQPEQRWNPCSERLPDMARRVLLSGHGQVMVGVLHSFGKYSLEPTGISHVYPKDDIEAWMPLPEPYRKEGEADE